MNPEVVVILITGFAQPRNISNGLGAIAKRLHEHGRTTGFKRPTRIWELTWKQNPAHFAKSLSHLYGPPLLVLAGHSYGGWACVRLAWELKKLGRDVAHLIVADAVDKRDESGPNDKLLEIPANVGSFHSWRQTGRRPRGSVLRVDESKTFWGTGDQIVQGVGHARMDELPSFQMTVFELATDPGSEGLGAGVPARCR